MNLKLKSCKSDANTMTLCVEDTETKMFYASAISTRTCGGPFLQHDAAVAQLVADLLAAINGSPLVALASPEVEAVDVVELPVAPRKGKTLPPKGAA